MSTENEYPLAPQEREVLDAITGQILALEQQRTGMLSLLASVRGIKNAAISYRDGKIITMQRERTLGS